MEEPPAVAVRRGVPLWALVAAALLAGAAGWLMRTPSKPTELPLRAFSFTPDSLATTNYAHRAVISPNGKYIAYVAANKLWIRDMASERGLDGTRQRCGALL